jgi:hypothetical protein
VSFSNGCLKMAAAVIASDSFTTVTATAAATDYSFAFEASVSN